MKVTNINTLGIANQLSKTSKAIARSMERLSSGKRVNRPQDDAAAYAMGVNLDSQIRGFAQGTRNANDAMGAMQTADAAMSAQLDILQRMREIAVQASNGTLSATDRNGLNAELQQIYAEYNRIALETEFNGMKLLDGSFGTKTLQIGASSSSAQSQIQMGLGNLSAGNVFTKTVGTGSFTIGSTLTTGNFPASIQALDLNGDGHLDLLEADDSDNTISVYLGKGDGTFGARRTTIVGTSPAYLDTGDLNNDGVRDLVVNNGSNTIYVLLGNGDGSFKGPTLVAGASSPTGLKLGDVNGDGKLDMVEAESVGPYVSIMLGNGDGTFQTRKSFTTGASPLELRLADLNGDGKLDVVTANGGAATLSVLLNDGSGNFQSKVDYNATGVSADVEAGDFDGDGDIDLIAANSANTIAVLLNSGNGTFGTATNYTIGNSPQVMKSSDFNGDGILDIITQSGTTATLSVLLGNGNGSFATAITVANAGPLTFGIAPADFNEDGVNDFATSNGSAANSISIYLARTITRSAGSDVSVATQSKAQSLIKVMDTAITNLKNQKASVAAQSSRLDFTMNANESLVESLSAARSQALDVDIAEEVAELTRNQILQQVQVAAMGQANLQMQIVLNLLKFS